MPKSQVREHHLEEQECPSSWWESSQEQNCYSWGQIWIKSVGRWGPGSSLCHTHFLKNSFWWKMRLPGWSLKTLLPHSFPLCGFLPSALWLWRWERALSWGLGTSTMHNPSEYWPSVAFLSVFPPHHPFSLHPPFFFPKRIYVFCLPSGISGPYWQTTGGSNSAENPGGWGNSN